jgi:hypothetical protein
MKMVGKGTADLEASERRYLELGAEEQRIAQELADAERPDAIELHPEAAERYRAKVADIHVALKSSGAASREAIAIVRDLIDHILVTPTQRPDPVDLTVVGNLAALLSENLSGTRVAESLVAGAGFRRQDYAAPEIKEFFGPGQTAGVCSKLRFIHVAWDIGPRAAAA